MVFIKKKTPILLFVYSEKYCYYVCELDVKKRQHKVIQLTTI